MMSMDKHTTDLVKKVVTASDYTKQFSMTNIGMMSPNLLYLGFAKLLG